MELFDKLGLDGSYIVLGVAVVLFLIFIIQIVILVKQKKLKKKYQAFMEGSDGKTLESTVLHRFEEIDQLKIDTKALRSDVDKTAETLLSAYQKSSIVKYDAFKEMGGKLSFSLCLLDDNNNGFIITSMHSSREGCYTYVKEIIKGESFVLLSEEEKQVLSEAKNKKNYFE